MKMNEQIVFVLRCALADLQGSMDACSTNQDHDWKAHAQTIEDIENLLIQLGENHEKN
jgi:hypothetical protein